MPEGNLRNQPPPVDSHRGIKRAYVFDGTLTATAIVVRLRDTVQEPSETARPWRRGGLSTAVPGCSRSHPVVLAHTRRFTERRKLVAPLVVNAVRAVSVEVSSPLSRIAATCRMRLVSLPRPATRAECCRRRGR